MFSRIALVAGLASIIGLVLMQSPALADHGDISLPMITFIQADEGEIVELVSETVDPELVGATCSWEFHANNQESVHLGNDLIISTGGVDTVVPGVEDAPDQILDVTGSFQLGETVTVSLRMGPDEMFSAGLTVEVVCEDDVASPTATTTPAPATTVAAAPTPATPVPSTTAASAVETEVAGNVETTASSASVAQAAPAASALAVTGPTSLTGQLVAFGVLLLLVGAGVVRLGSRAWN